MYIESPATIAILGAGPIGLEAALYARYLGYDVQLFERGTVADNVLRWGHVRMFSPFHMNASPLGLQALAAQDERFSPPDADAFLTGNEWAKQYLLPLANSDLIVDSLRLNTQVLAIGRSNLLKEENIGDAARADAPFRLLVEDEQGQRTENAAAVIDCTGTFGNHNWCGSGGVPAVGETTLADKIDYGLPDILGEDRARFAGKKTLVIGGGYSAATNVVALAELVGETNGEVNWITKNDAGEGPMRRIPDDRLEARDALAARANQLAAGGTVQNRSDAIVEGILYEGQQFAVTLTADSDAEEITFDNIIANVGYRPDHSIYEELQVHQCYATGGPMKLAAALLGKRSTDCLDQTSHGPQALLNPEPNFYILGSKSYGRNSHFLVSVGLEQIRDVFTIIGDREDLDLYATMKVSP